MKRFIKVIVNVITLAIYSASVSKEDKAPPGYPATLTAGFYRKGVSFDGKVTFSAVRVFGHRQKEEEKLIKKPQNW
jgi:hypothetical protein